MSSIRRIAALALLTLALVLAASPASAMIKRGFYADCYSFQATSCSQYSGCITQHCDQCDYYQNGVYTGSDVACY